MQRWIDLLSQLEVVDDEQNRQIMTEAELSAFEAKTGIVLPAGYKEFCQVFGTGRFGELIEVYCPSVSTIAFSNYTLNVMRVSFDMDGNKEVATSVYDLLNSAFIFGAEDAYSAFWDLRTYSEADQSYDIYWALTDFLGDAYLVGRDFFEFVRDFCLGTKAYEILPEDLHPYEGQISKTFMRFRSS